MSPEGQRKMYLDIDTSKVSAQNCPFDKQEMDRVSVDLSYSGEDIVYCAHGIGHVCPKCEQNGLRNVLPDPKLGLAFKKAVLPFFKARKDPGTEGLERNIGQQKLNLKKK